MTQTVTSVPEHVTRAQVDDLVRTLGVDPAELVWLSIDETGISAEVTARREDGTEVPNATHRMFVRIEETP